MKNFLLLVLFVIANYGVFCQNRAEVKKVNGIEVYIMNEPIREYKMVGEVSVYDSGFGTEYIDTWTTKYVNKAIKEMKKNIKVDALIYSDGRKAILVEFTDTCKSKSGLAKIDKRQGLYIYLMCSPLIDNYKIVGDIGVYDAGLSSMYIADWVKKYVKKTIDLTEKGTAVNAILYESGRKASAITF